MAGVESHEVIRSVAVDMRDQPSTLHISSHRNVGNRLTTQRHPGVRFRCGVLRIEIITQSHRDTMPAIVQGFRVHDPGQGASQRAPHRVSLPTSKGDSTFLPQEACVVENIEILPCPHPYFRLFSIGQLVGRRPIRLGSCRSNRAPGVDLLERRTIPAW